MNMTIKGGRKNKSGTPHCGVVSPFLTNVYMNRFLKYWRIKSCDEVFRAWVISYADDFVILSRGRASEALDWTVNVMTRLGLRLNEASQ
jgi:RNA-directed DNA polymerase